MYYLCTVKKRPHLYPGRSCDSRLFRADKTDAAVWTALRELFSRPEELQNGLIEHNASLQERSVPLRAELATVHSVIDEQQQQLSKLLDLYLAGTFGRDIVEERKAIIERAITQLEDQAARLEAQINADMLTEEELETLCEFSEHIADALDTADSSFDMRRLLVDTLDVNARLAREDGREFAYIECHLGELPPIGLRSINGP